MNKAGTCKKLLEPGNKKDPTNKWLTSYGRFLLFTTILRSQTLLSYQQRIHRKLSVGGIYNNDIIWCESTLQN